MSTSIAEPRWYYIGPHGYFDLVRLARRGRSTLVRVIYLLVLFVALALVHQNETKERTRFRGFTRIEPMEFVDPEDTINANARIAERFSITILLTQNIAVLV